MDLDIPSKNGAFELQNEWSEYFQTVVLPRLSDIFDKIAPKNRVLRLDSLEIDLGNVSLEEFEWRLVQEIEQQLKSFQNGESVSDNTLNIKELTATQEIAEVFVYFLKNGTMPWWINSGNLPDLEKAVNPILDKISHPLLSELNNDLNLEMADFELGRIITQKNFKQVFQDYFIVSQKVVFTRLIAQFSDDFIENLFAKIFNSTKNIIQQQFQELEKAGHTAFTKVTTYQKRVMIWAGIVQQIISNKTQPINNLIKIEKTTNNFSKPEENIFSKKEEDLRIANMEANNPILNTKTPTDNFQKAIPLKKKTSTEISTQGYFIDNAGLVLIAPYLGAFFNVVGLADHKNFKTDDARQRAIHLLQYLTGVDSKAPEYLLVLNKILCQLPFEMPIQRDIELTEAEKSEADNLLKAIIQNWSALKSTTAPGLQETFIRRKGKLTFQQHSKKWLLQVEGKSFDVLLSQLPWTYSMVKLPWMEEMLVVEWG